MVTELTDFIADFEDFVGQPVPDLGRLGPAAVAADDMVLMGPRQTHTDGEQQREEHLHGSHGFPGNQTGGGALLSHSRTLPISG